MNKIDKIKSEGLENLQFVLDFDRTITGPINNKSANPMIHYLRNGDMLGEEYRTQAQTNFEKYYPIEKDHEISQEVKNKLMHEWWIAHLSMLVKFKLNKNMISKIAYLFTLVFFFCCVDKKVNRVVFEKEIPAKEEATKTYLQKVENNKKIKII